MGEANSRARPLNSLLEEDLEFEHSQRVVPVITEEKVKTLEEMIKARIIEVRFAFLAGTFAFSPSDFRVALTMSFENGR